MLQRRGADALLLALSRALHERLYGAEYVRWFLDHAPQGQQEPEA
jgi:hypothetical protein